MGRTMKSKIMLLLGEGEGRHIGVVANDGEQIYVDTVDPDGGVA